MKLEEILKNNNVVDSWENRPEAFTGEKTDVATFIGPNSASWSRGDYEEALQMEKWGMTPEDIWRKTGNGRGIDNKWRQEISDYGASLSNYQEGPDILQNKLNHDPLYEAYPGIENSFIDSYPEGAYEKDYLGLHFNRDEQDLDYYGKGLLNFAGKFGQGSHADRIKNVANAGIDENSHYPKKGAEEWMLKNFWPNNNYNQFAPESYDYLRNMSEPNIRIKEGGADIFNTLLHENQHSIQSIEGWESGHAGDIESLMQDPIATDLINNHYKDQGLAWYNETTNDYDKPYNALDYADKEFMMYELQQGEAEARATERRKNLGPSQRRENFPFEQNDDYGYDIDFDLAQKVYQHSQNRY